MSPDPIQVLSDNPTVAELMRIASETPPMLVKRVED